jgi:hypothetical protein
MRNGHLRSSSTQQPAEIIDGAGQPGVEINGRIPVQDVAGQIDVRHAAYRIIHRQRVVLDACAGTHHADDLRRQLQHGEFARIAEIDRAGDVVRRVHEPNQTVDHVLDVAERARL